MYPVSLCTFITLILKTIPLHVLSLLINKTFIMTFLHKNDDISYPFNTSAHNHITRILQLFYSKTQLSHPFLHKIRLHISCPFKKQTSITTILHKIIQFWLTFTYNHKYPALWQTGTHIKKNFTSLFADKYEHIICAYWQKWTCHLHIDKHEYIMHTLTKMNI